MYANSGFWLEYLRHFSKFKIHLVDLDYFDLDDEMSEFRAFLHSQVNDCSDMILIGHSYGAHFVDVFSFFHEEKIKKVGINPGHLGLNKKNGAFLMRVKETYGLDIRTIEEDLDIAYRQIYKYKMKKSTLDVILTADNDEYFDFSNLAGRYDFCGDHYAIDHGLKRLFQFLD